MNIQDRIYSVPTRRFTRWLVDPGRNVPPDIRVALVGGLFGSLPIFFGGIINTLLVAALITLRRPEPPFLLWLAMESLICATRIVVLVSARRSALAHRPTPTDLYVVLALLWAGSVGYGTFISLTSGDWIAATLACLSAASMVGGICVRNFGAPRLSAAMVALSVGPCALAALFTQEPIFWLVLVQVPLYMTSMSMASYRLNGMLVSTMLAERENERQARQDSLTGLLNRYGLLRALDQAVSRASQGKAEFAVLYLDLDGFKSVNDTYGHGAGDTLLKQVSERLQALKPPGAEAGRIGGDEFVLLMRLDGNEDIRRFSDRIIDSVRQPYDLQQAMPVYIGGSIGIALIPRHGADTAAVLHAADQALYLAKSAGKSRAAMAQL
ncbi:sensor domain-containing diguanylate cyclase [Achromobacter xylosoxidans]|uniref:Sensor domain-containing diguanylate cyclase n=1 Tax=Alcaligenes xylosoxydans xylosoxydans TaxID=85698 RepID=A0A120LH72_ALCXX|nr:diguanylate cyclase [Achromobacter xylosoxidans]AMG36293.1 sensor domain-containing diguanylate cyclase [Achromobacter xylosoxidans]